ncbi:MAG: hypothetical protein OQK55_03245 [Thermoanaerobaculales bacterium]|nr:hypothetical protein [Thermoanaerobaculales bacterium]
MKRAAIIALLLLVAVSACVISGPLSAGSGGCDARCVVFDRPNTGLF